MARRSYSEEMLESLEKQSKKGGIKTAAGGTRALKKASEEAEAKRKGKKKVKKKKASDSFLNRLSDSDFMKRFK